MLQANKVQPTRRLCEQYGMICMLALLCALAVLLTGDISRAICLLTAFGIVYFFVSCWSVHQRWLLTAARWEHEVDTGQQTK